MSDSDFRFKLGEVSKGLDLFDQVIHSVDTKAKKGRTLKTMSTDVGKGKKLVANLKTKLKELSVASKQRGGSSSRQSQFKKVANDFRNQIRHFDQICKYVYDKEARDEDDRTRKPQEQQEMTTFRPKDHNEDQVISLNMNM